MGLEGMRVISFESRRSNEIGELIRRQGGSPFVAPAMREVPIENNSEAFDFAERLFRGEFDMIVFLTGAGTRALAKVIETRYSDGQFAAALRNITTVVRGPKPASALREMNVPITIPAPAPNTWREVLAATEGRPEKRIAVQEYGRSNPELLRGLADRGAEVTRVPVYQWELPLDLGPLREAARRIASANADVVLFTTSVQVAHLMRIAAEEGVADAIRAGFQDAVVASIGPTTTEALEEYGISPDLEPEQGKMGLLVRAVSEQAAEILAKKRGGSSEAG